MKLKRLMLTAAAAAAACMFAGCSSFSTATNLSDLNLTTAPNKSTIAHVHGEVWGIYLLGAIPIFSGSTAVPERCAMFDDTVTVPCAVGMVAKMSRTRLNADTISDLQTEGTSTWLAPTILFWYKSIQVSGNALR